MSSTTFEERLNLAQAVNALKCGYDLVVTTFVTTTSQFQGNLSRVPLWALLNPVVQLLNPVMLPQVFSVLDN